MTGAAQLVVVPRLEDPPETQVVVKGTVGDSRVMVEENLRHISPWTLRNGSSAN